MMHMKIRAVLRAVDTTSLTFIVNRLFVFISAFSVIRSIFFCYWYLFCSPNCFWDIRLIFYIEIF